MTPQLGGRCLGEMNRQVLGQVVVIEDGHSRSPFLPKFTFACPHDLKLVSSYISLLHFCVSTHRNVLHVLTLVFFCKVLNKDIDQAFSGWIDLFDS